MQFCFILFFIREAVSLPPGKEKNPISQLVFAVIRDGVTFFRSTISIEKKKENRQEMLSFLHNFKTFFGLSRSSKKSF